MTHDRDDAPFFETTPESTAAWDELQDELAENVITEILENREFDVANPLARSLVQIECAIDALEDGVAADAEFMIPRARAAIAAAWEAAFAQKMAARCRYCSWTDNQAGRQMVGPATCSECAREIAEGRVP